GAKTAETILENAGREDPSMEGIEPTTSANGGERADSSRDTEPASNRTDTDNSQSSLGDF
ncbi:hypothetical protein, partial [Natronorubrum bangense]